MKIRKRKLGALLMFVQVFCLSACETAFLPSYGLVSINSVNGKHIYFKRMAQGLSFDVTVISTSSSLCDIPNANSDFVFRGLGGPEAIYYKIENGELILFTADVLSPPASNDFPIPVKHTSVDSSGLRNLEENYETTGLQKVVVNFDPDLKCG